MIAEPIQLGELIGCCLLCYAPNKNLKINCKLAGCVDFLPHGCCLMHSLDVFMFDFSSILTQRRLLYIKSASPFSNCVYFE